MKFAIQQSALVHLEFIKDLGKFPIQSAPILTACGQNIAKLTTIIYALIKPLYLVHLAK